MTESDLISVVDYARASADKSKDEHTVKDQRRVNELTAKRLGCKIVARFADNDKSAMKDGVIRDEFEEMLGVLRTGQLADGTRVMGCIVVADDRLVRRTGDYERFVDALTFEEGRVYADARGFKDLYSEDVESMGLMGAVISRMEIKKMRRRAREWHRARAREGNILPGNRPFGWLEDRKTLHPVEAPLLRQAALRVLAGGSVTALCNEWQRKGVKTPRGNDWVHVSLSRVLKNPRLCGWRMIRGELIMDDRGEPVSGQWEPIITPGQWQALHAIFAERKGKVIDRFGGDQGQLPRDFREHSYLLSAIARCGVVLDDGTLCHRPLRAGQVTNADYHRYLCKAPAIGGCGRLTRRGDVVDEFVTEAVLAKLEERTTGPTDVGPWLGERELEMKQEQMRELRLRFAKHTISNTLFFTEVERLEPEIQQLRADQERFNLTAQRAAQDLTAIRRRWYSETDEDRLDLSQKRGYIREALHAVIVHPAGKGRRPFNPDLLELVWRE
ncbi:recombinase family protein [Actinomadura macra]|uniref:recombinase family protein n=1 Tax=Actinomadura macra TaxID=46164 RepID=UPI000A04FA9D|nr:recombinase family protein [Actinomadura macra]